MSTSRRSVRVRHAHHVLSHALALNLSRPLAQDVPLQCADGGMARAHTLVLAALSPVLKSYLLDVGNSPNAGEPLVVLPDTDVEHLGLFFEYLHDDGNGSGKVRYDAEDMPALEEVCRVLGLGS